ncbi:exodeoxyribonuclease V subunit alpha [Ramlibacter tataouinensis]|uniref:RecBCD enzyme subunit RecD n=2 Tax=Ramlibacter tataouinensis TaxID=94132 RepID=A0A127K201_9BURK|nr:exodeoxyribonuclease V subunit alpha [Ramlibacter tataouinensis]
MPDRARECLQQLRVWVDAGWLRELDFVFAAFLARESPDADPLLLLAAALASHQLGRGHVCLEPAAVLKDPALVLALPPERAEEAGRHADAAPAKTPVEWLSGLAPAAWVAALSNERLVGSGAGDTPLVLAGSRLYLRRYWQYEQTVRAAIEQRVAAEPLDASTAGSLRQALDALFGPAASAGGEPDWQKIACALAVRSHFGIVTGGPGTGKTTTVVKLLAVLQHLAPRDAQGKLRPLRIRLAAPTGKAAARLNESIAGAVKDLPLGGLPDAQALREAIPTEVTTVHRLLVPVPGTRRFRHDARNPLPLDVLVLDEASMVGLEAMAAVVAALAPRTRLVLLGDKDQLASVEAGGLFGQLCRWADAGRYTAATRDWVYTVSGEAIPPAQADDAGRPLDQCVVKLRKSWRFGEGSGIGQLAQAVNEGDVKRIQEIRSKGRADLAWLDLANSEAGLRRLVLEGGPEFFGGRGQGRLESSGVVAPPVGLSHYLGVMNRGPRSDAQEDIDTWARGVLDASLSFQLLCAVRGGRHGVERLNERIADLLHAEGLVAAAQGWFAGRPVMVTHNDYTLGLMNGDIGIALQVPEQGKPMLRVAFPANGGGVRWVLPSRLESVETAFAMTVHKSQGSEFVHTALVLPDRPSPVLTRELVYTAVTRAKSWFTLAGPLKDGLLEQAVQRPTLRAGGLF